MADKKSYRKLTDDGLAKIAKKFKTKRTFFDGDPSAFVTASRRGILDAICTHMFDGRFRWTDAMICNEAKKYKTRTEFSNGSRAAYSAARRRGILDKACKHMTKKQKKKRSV